MPRTGESCPESGVYRCDCRTCQKPVGQEPRVGLAVGTRFPPCSDCFGTAVFTAVGKSLRPSCEECESAQEERA